MLAAEDSEPSQEQQGLPDGEVHAGVLQDAMFRWEPAVLCRNARSAPQFPDGVSTVVPARPQQRWTNC